MGVWFTSWRICSMFLPNFRGVLFGLKCITSRDVTIAKRVRFFTIRPDIIHEQRENELYTVQVGHCEDVSGIRKLAHRVFRRFKPKQVRVEEVSNDYDYMTTAKFSENLCKIIPLMVNLRRYKIVWEMPDSNVPTPYIDLSWNHFAPTLTELHLVLSHSKTSSALPPMGISFPHLETFNLTLSFDNPFGRAEHSSYMGAQSAVADYVNSLRSSLKKLAIRCTPPMNLSHLYSHLDHFEKLDDLYLGISLDEGPNRPAPSASAAFIGKHSQKIRSLSLFVFVESAGATWDSPERQFTLDGLFLPNLSTLHMSAAVLFSNVQASIPTFFAQQAPSLKELSFGGPLAINVRLPLVLQGLNQQNPSNSLSSLSFFSAYLDSALLNNLAVSLPLLQTLALDIREVTSRGRYLSMPSDTFPESSDIVRLCKSLHGLLLSFMILQSTVSHPFIQEMSLHHSFTSWRLRDLTIKRHSCCGDLFLWGLMAFCTHHIPSINSFMGSGSLSIPNPQNVKPTRGPIWCADLVCRYGQDHKVWGLDELTL